MKNILIGTDFSKEAYCALFYATQLFKDENALFYISNFYGDKIHTSVYSIINEEEFSKAPKLRTRSEAGCAETLHHIVRDTGLSADRFRIISSDQKLTKGIEDLVREKDIDLVVMGTRKHDRPIDSLLETNTTRIIDRSLPCPLLIVPREMDYKKPLKISFGSELIRPFCENSFKLLKDIALKFGSQITVVYDGEEGSLSKAQRQNYHDLKSFFEDVPVHFEYYSTHVEVSKTHSEYVKKNNVHHLSMIYYKHSFSSNIFREHVVEQIDRHLSFPFLILPAKS